MATPLTIYLDDAEEATLRLLSLEHKVSPEVLVLNNLRVSMRDFTKNRIAYHGIQLGGGRKVQAPEQD